MPKPGVEMLGLDRMLAGLAAMPARLATEITKDNRKVADKLTDAARSGAESGLDSAITPIANAKEAGIEIGPPPERALGSFYGAIRRFGWYAGAQYKNSVGRQFPLWVGSGWTPGSNDNKPYQIGDALNEAHEKVLDIYTEAVPEASSLAFPIKK